MSEMKATNVKGKVTATNAKCEVRQINEGDKIQPGEVVKTADGANVMLESIDGSIKEVEGKQTVTLDAEVFAGKGDFHPFLPGAVFRGLHFHDDSFSPLAVSDFVADGEMEDGLVSGERQVTLTASRTGH